MQPDRTGTFRCQPTEWAVSKSTGGYPQLVARLYLTEWYDQEEKEWIDFSEFQMEITGYFILYGRTKGTDKLGPTLNHQQVMKVFNWDGQSFSDLANGDYSELTFQARIDENTYEGAKNPFQVGWIDEYDADPNRQLKKLKPDELKALDAEFAGLINKPAKVVTAKKALPKIPAKAVAQTVATSGATKTVVATVEVATEEIKAEEAEPETPAQRKAKMAAKSARLKAEAEKAAVKKPSVPAPPPRTPAGQVKSDCTKQLAWESIVELRDPKIDDNQLRASWTAAINEIAGAETDDSQITPGQWHVIKEKVMSETAIF